MLEVRGLLRDLLKNFVKQGVGKGKSCNCS